jgi:hypothetical protein
VLSGVIIMKMIAIAKRTATYVNHRLFAPP